MFVARSVPELTLNLSSFLFLFYYTAAVFQLGQVLTLRVPHEAGWKAQITRFVSSFTR